MVLGIKDVYWYLVCHNLVVSYINLKWIKTLQHSFKLTGLSVVLPDLLNSCSLWPFPSVFLYHVPNYPLLSAPSEFRSKKNSALSGLRRE